MKWQSQKVQVALYRRACIVHVFIVRACIVRGTDCSRIKHITVYFHGNLIVRAPIVRAIRLPRTIDDREQYMFYGIGYYVGKKSLSILLCYNIIR